ncbi:MAG TPA: hypothetical protein EYP57_01515 [Thermodesulfobacteriaceae bacterium]|nr:hypothetical protein [Thermodesulfobacteriaceae bacterium]
MARLPASSSCVAVDITSGQCVAHYFFSIRSGIDSVALAAKARWRRHRLHGGSSRDVRMNERDPMSGLGIQRGYVLLVQQ